MEASPAIRSTLDKQYYQFADLIADVADNGDRIWESIADVIRRPGLDPGQAIWSKQEQKAPSRIKSGKTV